MEKLSIKTFIREPKNQLFLVAILIAFLLRFYQLGHDSFWIDEVGVVIAAKASSLNQTLSLAKEHVSAMPLNYLQTRLLLKFAENETWLRLPSAIWGTLAIISLYFLGKRLTDKITALIAVIILAVHPFHIQYSQELRFYASGTFFYLFGTLTLLNAFEKNRLKYWMYAIAIIIIGAYDSPFTIFAWLNVFAISLFQIKRQNRHRFIPLLISGIIIGLGFLPGYLIFGIENPMNYVATIEMVRDGIAIGLGWIPYYFSTNPILLLFGLILFITFIWGLTILAFRRDNLLLPLLLSILFQNLLIIFTDIKLNYFISPRQFLVFLPISLLVSAYSISCLYSFSKPIFGINNKRNMISSNSYKKINMVFSTVIILLILFSSIPNLKNYYHIPKSYAHEITIILKDQLKEVDKVVCSPNYEIPLFKYYFEKEGISITKDDLVGIELNKLEKSSSSTGNIYLITRSNLTKEQEDSIKSKDFYLIWSQPVNDPNAHRLYLYQPKVIEVIWNNKNLVDSL